ncbi:MAG TPA: hypothetical protein VFC46_03000 [Humisphaera sp.]|nr:hypothetical protein [Humisphaera sp.]
MLRVIQAPFLFFTVLEVREYFRAAGALGGGNCAQPPARAPAALKDLLNFQRFSICLARRVHEKC